MESADRDEAWYVPYIIARCLRTQMCIVVGKVNLCSPDHVALLVHRTFNVSIPRHHIPTDQWEFEYGPAENDPEFSAEIAPDAAHDADVGATVESGGRWVHSITSSKLGEEDGYVEFTVVGYVDCHLPLHEPF